MPMPAMHADVTAPSGEVYEKAVAMSTRKARFILHSSSGQPITDVESLAVRPSPDGVFEVDTPDGTYTVKRRGGCGCGKRR